jgi:hypothetical protein
VLNAPGRTASGEAFDYDQLEFSIDLRSSGKLVVRECYRLTSHTNPCRICDKVSLSSGRLEDFRNNFFEVNVEDSWLQFVSCTLSIQVSFDRRGPSCGNVRLFHESATPRVKPAVRQKFVVATALDDLPALKHEDLIGVTNG